VIFGFSYADDSLRVGLSEDMDIHRWSDLVEKVERLAGVKGKLVVEGEEVGKEDCFVFSLGCGFVCTVQPPSNSRIKFFFIFYFPKIV
jgi:hypothetical protein